MKTGIKFIIVLFVCCSTGLVAFINLDNLESLFKPLVSNRLVIADESVAAAFTFTNGEALPIDTPIVHLKLMITDLKNLGALPALSQEGTIHPSLMITVETWGPDLLFPFKRNPLKRVIKGEFDRTFIQLFERIAAFESKVYLRFNPEMEVPAHSYPWQNNMIDYINGFRHFAMLCRQYARKAKIVWAPAGYPGSMEFYPGDDVVGAASITVKSNSENELKVYPKNYSIQYDLKRRLHRLRFVDKPIFVLEPKEVQGETNQQILDAISKHTLNEKDNVYSAENFMRPGPRKMCAADSLIIGFYDPQGLLVDEPAVSVEHLFVDFTNLRDGSFEQDFAEVEARGHNVIITFEPFTRPVERSDRDVLTNMTAGKYDREVGHFYNIICATNQTVYLRYAHEMEIPITRYPWQSKDPVTYIHSFRYFMQFPAANKQHIIRVWGPAGDRGSIEWYPGNDVVDLVSIAIYGLPDKNITDPEMQESFADIFNRKSWRMRFIDKPLFITECGVKGPEEYQTHWLLAAANILRQNNQAIGINYFNMSDTPKAWGDIKPPDWSITKVSFNRFIAELRKDYPQPEITE